MHDKIEDLILVKMFQNMFGYYVLERIQNWKLVRIDTFKFRNMEKMSRFSQIQNHVLMRARLKLDVIQISRVLRRIIINS